MRFSYQWIKDFVTGLDTHAKELEQLITVRTAESDGIHTVGELLHGARVARVVNAEPVPGTHIIKAIVDIGDAGSITVACGAPNCRAGLQTIWVPLGRKTIQGVESNGMLASAAELGVGRAHEGIIEWNEPTITLEPDQVIEIDNKSLTHRPDLWGHFGMAREVAAITKHPLRDPVDLSVLPSGSGGFQVRVGDEVLCPRFSAVAFEDVRVAPSPYWLQYRLTSVGMNPINNVVDITNYVAAELAQPMHAFDRDKLRGDRLLVRNAHADEKVLALDDHEYTLTAADGVVVDEAGPVAIAGIIGGKESAVSDATTRVVFEAANWNASQIRKTSARLKLRTDASMRFEKAQDPVNTPRALARAVELMKIVCPGARPSGGFTDVSESLGELPVIPLNLNVLDRKLGREIPQQEVVEILERLEFHTKPGGDRSLLVTVPSWRATKDVAVPDDLVEEVGRMVGYDTITPRPPLVECAPPPDDPKRNWLRDLRALLTSNGYTEVYNYSFLSDADAERFGLQPADTVRVLNPIASDQNILRSSLIPGIFATLELNRKHFASFRLFEMGREIHNQAPAMPREVLHLVAAIYDAPSSLFELKRIAEAIAPEVRVEQVSETQGHEHPTRTANLILGEAKVGRLFESHPSMIEGRAAILDLNLDRLLAERKPLSQYTPIRRYPTSAFDLSIVVPERLAEFQLKDEVRKHAGPLLESVEYLTQYPQPSSGTKSISYRVTVGAPDRTLSSAEISAVRAEIIDKLQALGYELKV
jgi:phenylalanyl-tRNA synthetase beta chain